jgi:hypothetical protein
MTMREVSPLRLNILRLAYVFVAVGLGSIIWPVIFSHSGNWDLNAGVKKSMLGAFSLLALIGIRYPLTMLPLLFWDIVWKGIWFVVVALPLWSGGRLEGDFAFSAFENGFALILILAIPWDYVWNRYVRGPAEPWRTREGKSLR